MRQLLSMRDALRRLEHERKRLRHLGGPFVEHLRFGHAIESVVDFDGVEPTGIKLQHFRSRKIFGIETSLPLLVAVAARPDADAHGVTIIAGCANSCWQ